MARPLFVVTAPRSGSTFVVQLLDAHQRVRLVNELCFVPFLRRMFLLASTPAGEEIEDGEGFRTPGILPIKHAWNFAHTFLDAMPPFVEDLFGRVAGGLADAAYYGDKVTSVNDLKFLLERFPDPLFVYLLRDPRDVIASTYAFQQKQQMLWDSSAFETRVAHLERFLRETRELLRDRQHHTLRYEDLMADVPRHTKEVFAFLGLDVSESVEAYLQGTANELFSSHGTSSSPAASIGRWRRDLTEEQQALANAGLATELRQLGY